MTAKHTPGPWFVNGPWLIQADTPHELPRYVAEIKKPHGVSTNEREANARLIAAAPELLAALEGILYHFVPEQGNLKVEQEMIKSAHAAIAKAKEGQP